MQHRENCPFSTCFADEQLFFYVRLAKEDGAILIKVFDEQI